MRRTGLIIAALSVLAACSASRPNVPVQENFPPVGLASTAVWLEQRQALSSEARLGAAQAQAATVPDARLQSASSTVSVPERARPNTRQARAVQAFRDICVASVSDVSRLPMRMLAVNLRDFDGPARNRTNSTGGQVLVGGIPDGPIRTQTEVNTAGGDRALCGVSTISVGSRAIAQEKIGTLADAGFRLEPTQTRGRAQQSWQIVGAPAGTTLNVRTTGLGAGAWIAWR
ncbi:hypothetical protein [Tateyamaria omphalii]|uniref:Uncharacterized protein n=1 Tax=Tateyamaria omphalii TaxID=299262 RepID=A0A1P8MQY9_9RHOB|nr:hypothetical protein [Tateyamaria omphalii]APX10432.1 hypothetical protein BWR18_00985 [Tateyamaria omphalii]